MQKRCEVARTLEMSSAHQASPATVTAVDQKTENLTLPETSQLIQSTQHQLLTPAEEYFNWSAPLQQQQQQQWASLHTMTSWPEPPHGNCCSKPDCISEECWYYSRWDAYYNGTSTCTRACTMNSTSTCTDMGSMAVDYSRTAAAAINRYPMLDSNNNTYDVTRSCASTDCYDVLNAGANTGLNQFLVKQEPRCRFCYDCRCLR